MNQNIIVPDIGDFESVEIIEILVKIGDQINKDDPIVTLESDKSSVEVPSQFSGKISELNVKIGDRVSKGSLLAKLESNSSNSYPEESQKKYASEQKPDIRKITNTAELESNKIIKKISTQVSSKDDIDPSETQEWMAFLQKKQLIF